VHVHTVGGGRLFVPLLQLQSAALRTIKELPSLPSISSHPHELAVGCLHMHYEFKADGRAGGSSPTQLSETNRAAAVFGATCAAILRDSGVDLSLGVGAM
jgi:hypothetical protein